VTRPRCLIADDHPPLVDALAAVLAKSGFEPVGPVSNGIAAVDTARNARPELAVIDYRMPGCSGRELLEELVRVSPDMRIVVFTGHPEPGLVAEALAAGAAGVVSKAAPLADLVRALTVASSGRSYVDPDLATTQAGGGERLTSREIEAVRLLSEGLSYDEIGRRLSISGETVRVHLRKASKRLGVSSRTHLVATALRRRLIT
jgi:DNA-binding NarL/FixJ family response regulator